MTDQRSILVTTELPVTRPGGGFDSACSLGATRLGADISPFVDLTEFHMTQPVFRPHPHAGFSAVTYLFEDSLGSFRNRWSKGDTDLIPPGSLHWTQAGSGMLHEEVPVEPGVDCHGVQMFVKLAAAEELSPPRAFHLDPDDIVELTPATGARVRLLAGTYAEVDAGIPISNSLTFAEVHLQPGAVIELPAPSHHNAFVFVQVGSIATGGHVLTPRHAAAFAHDGDVISIVAEATSSFLFGAGPGLDEPIHSSGPFMMSTPERLAEAADAHRRGDMGRLDPSF